LRELEIIRFIRERVADAPGVPTGIGDDAAVLSVAGVDRTVVTTDLLLEGTHFASEDDPALVGRKAIAVSLSDVAAMGCRPAAALLAVGLAREHAREYVEGLLEGARAVCAEYDVPLVGGDTTESRGPAVLCSTVLGVPPEGCVPVLRSGARPGDDLYVTGRLGGSLAGRHLRFPPRVKEALALVAGFSPTAMLDLSDGLSTDAWHLARESGVTLRIQAAFLPVSDRAANAKDARSALDHALNDGEDFELLFTLPASEDPDRLTGEGLAGTRVTLIGSVAEGPPAVTIGRDDGTEEEVVEGGYEHFR